MSITPAEAEQWRGDAQELQAVLMAATRERPKRPDFAPVSGELGWVVFERVTMFDAINRMRAAYGKASISRADVEVVEMRASGHVDYVAKFAVGAADLVHAP